MDQYELLETIGEGTYGVVFKCRHKLTNRIVAVKRFKEAHGNEYIRCTMIRELRVQQLLKGEPYVVQLLEAFQEKSTLFLVMENVPCNLLDVLDRQPHGLDKEKVRVLIFTLLLGLRSCHSNGIVHRDVKPENILVKPDGSATLCDFGFSRPITLSLSSRSASPAVQRWSKGGQSGKNAAESESDESDAAHGASRSSRVVPTLDELVLAQHQDCMTDYVATRWYRSPEMLLGMQQYDFAVDVWAVGAIMAEAADGQPLLPGNTEMEQLSLIQARIGPFPKQYQSLVRKRCGGVLPMQLSKSKNKNPLQSAPSSPQHSSYVRDRFLAALGSEGVDLLEKLLSTGAKHRISVAEALAHPFFAGLAERYARASHAASPVSREVSTFTGLPSSDSAGEDHTVDTASAKSRPRSPSSSTSSSSVSSAAFLTPVRVPEDAPPGESPNPRIEESRNQIPALVLRHTDRWGAVSTEPSSDVLQPERGHDMSDRRLPKRTTTSPSEPQTRRVSGDAAADGLARLPVTPDEALLRVSSSSQQARFLSSTLGTKVRKADKMPLLESVDRTTLHSGSLGGDSQQRLDGSTCSAQEGHGRLMREAKDTHKRTKRQSDSKPEPPEPYGLPRYASASRVHQKEPEQKRNGAWAKRKPLPVGDSGKEPSERRNAHRSRPPNTTPGDGPPLVPRDQHNTSATTARQPTAGSVATKRAHALNNSHNLQSSRSTHGSPYTGRAAVSSSRNASPLLKRRTMKATRPSRDEKPRLLREIETLTCAVAPLESLEELLPIPSPSTTARRESMGQAGPVTAAKQPLSDDSTTHHGETDLDSKTPSTTQDVDDLRTLLKDFTTREKNRRTCTTALRSSTGRQPLRSLIPSPAESELMTSSGHNVILSPDSQHDLPPGDGSTGNAPLPGLSHSSASSHGPQPQRHDVPTGAGVGEMRPALAASTRPPTTRQESKPRQMVFRTRHQSPLGAVRLADAPMSTNTSVLNASALPDADVGTGAEGGPSHTYSPAGFGRRPQPKLRRPPPLAQTSAPTRCLTAVDAPSLSPVALAVVVDVVDLAESASDADERPLPVLTNSRRSSLSLSPNALHRRAKTDYLADDVLLMRSRTNTPKAEGSSLGRNRDACDAPLVSLELNTDKRLHAMQPTPLNPSGEGFMRASPLPSYGSSSVVSPVAGVTMDSVVRFQQQHLSGSRKKTRLALTAPSHETSS